MKCYICNRIIRTKSAKYCPFCGDTLDKQTKVSYSHYTQLADENQMTRVEEMLVIINNKLDKL